MSLYQVRAYNTAHDSENKIHDDAVAKRFGFTGALVPGVDVYAYMMHLPVARWGREFLERGAAECRFMSPVYDGEMVDVSGLEKNGSIAIEVSSQGKSCATGSAHLSSPPSLKTYPEVKPPSMDDRPAASPATLVPGSMLGTQLFETSSEFLKT